MEIKPENFAKLTPVDCWEWALYKVEYSRDEDGEVRATRYLVSTPDHVEWEIMNCGCGLGSVTWTYVRDVAPPPKCGEYYGFPITMDGWTYGCKLAKG